MKKTAIALSAFGLLTAPAFAGDLEAHCEAYAENNGTDPAGCSCLADAADADATEELLEVETPEDIAALSDSAKAAIAACFPDA